MLELDQDLRVEVQRIGHPREIDPRERVEVVRAVAAATPPIDRAFELWAIAPGAARPRSLGVIPPSGELKLSPLPPDLSDGATLAISVEPLGGSPTQQPTGPVVFVGSVKSV